MNEDLKYVTSIIESAERYTGELLVMLPVARVRAVLAEIERLNRIVAEYRSRETLPTLGRFVDE
jgi:hypothetical protein